MFVGTAVGHFAGDVVVPNIILDRYCVIRFGTLIYNNTGIGASFGFLGNTSSKIWKNGTEIKKDSTSPATFSGIDNTLHAAVFFIPRDLVVERKASDPCGLTQVDRLNSSTIIVMPYNEGSCFGESYFSNGFLRDGSRVSGRNRIASRRFC